MHYCAEMAKHAAVLTRLGERVRELRRERGWSRKDLSERSHVSERFLADIESGRANPSLVRLLEVSEALGTTAERLLADAAVHSGVALLGLRGAGKSTIGLRLADRLGFEFVELDSRIEETLGLHLSEIFELHGEALYRRAELDVLTELANGAQPIVLATGGGIVSARETYDLLKSRFFTIWLKAAPEDHWSRVVNQGDTRPMANDDQAFSNLCALLDERQHLYGEARLVVDTSANGVDAVVDDLCARLGGIA